MSTPGLTPRYWWRAQHAITVWMMPNPQRKGEWRACIGDQTTTVTADTEDEAEKAICASHNIKHWSENP